MQAWRRTEDGKAEEMADDGDVVESRDFVC